MKIKLGSSIAQKFPGVGYTLILVKNAENLRKISSLSQLLRGTAVVTKNELKKVDRKNLFSQVTEQMTAEGAVFLEGYLLANRVKKILAGKEVEGKNNLINLVGFLSLKYFLPIHGFDLDQAEKDYRLHLYQPKKGKKAPDLDFLPETRNFVLWFPNLGNWKDEEIDRFVLEIDQCLAKYFHTGITEVFHLDSGLPEVDLGYESELEKTYREQKKEEEREEEASLAENTLPENSILPVGGQLIESETQPSIAEKIKKWLTEILNSSFTEISVLESLEDLSEWLEIEVPNDPGHGDLSTNTALKLAKLLNQPPRPLAEKMVQELQKKAESEPGLMAKVEAVGPGFINFHFDLQYFQSRLSELLRQKEKYGRHNLGHGEKIMIEWGSLNIAKPFGAQHFMTTIIGNTLVNLYRVIGYQVLSADFPGDWGTQFGKSIYAYKHWGDKDQVEKDPVNELLKLYVKFHEEAEKDPALDQAARDEFRKMEEGDQDNFKLWQWIVEVSTRDLYSIYQTLGVKHDRSYPESKYNEACLRILEKGKQLGIVTPGEKGAYIVDLEAEHLPPALVQKGDGTTLYTTRDLASIEDRLTGDPDLKKLVYVVDVAQTLSFKQLFAIAKRFHQADPSFPTAEFKHVAFGRMSFGDKGMSTRKGNIIQGREIIKEAHDRAEKIVREKLLENGAKFSPVELKNLIHGLAIGAIKYAMICQSPESDLVFDWDKVISFEGNSAPYLQYSLARASSILRKADHPQPDPESHREESSPLKTSKQVSEDQITLFSLEQTQKYSQKAEDLAAAEAGQTPFSQPLEQALLRLLVQFPDKVAAAALTYKPNTLTSYLHELAQTFNSFYTAVPVIKSSRPELREARLELVKAAVQVLRSGLQILGIATFDRM